MLKKFAHKSASVAKRRCGVQHLSQRQIFGPTEKTWDSLGPSLVSGYEEENPDWDPRTLSIDDIKHKFGLADALSMVEIPQLKLPENTWFTSNHMFVQQTHLDDIWRIGYTQMRFIGTRHVEWLEFDCVEKEKVMFSNALMYFSISDWKPLKSVGQSLTDIQYCLQCPFHRAQVVSYNRRVAEDPTVLISDERMDFKWLVCIKYTMKQQRIFEAQPIIDGRYGRWYDREQYAEWLKEEGTYKNWQMDEVSKQWEQGKLHWKEQMYGDSALSLNRALMPLSGDRSAANAPNRKPKFIALDEERRDNAASSFKPRWWPW